MKKKRAMKGVGGGEYRQASKRGISDRHEREILALSF